VPERTASVIKALVGQVEAESRKSSQASLDKILANGMGMMSDRALIQIINNASKDLVCEISASSERLKTLIKAPMVILCASAAF